MWKKDDATPAAPERTEVPPRRSREPGAPQQPAAASAPASAAASADQAAIGPSITIRGEVSGDEDLLIQGTVDGSVDLGQHAVQVGRDGRVKANITARIVTVEGEVEGDLRAEEQIVLRPSADVKGDITAPRIVLEDGARFRGLVEMGEAASRSNEARKEAGKGAGAQSGAGGSSGGSGASGNAGNGGKASSTSSSGGSDASDKDAAKAKSGADASSAAADASKAKPQKVGGEAR